MNDTWGSFLYIHLSFPHSSANQTEHEYKSIEDVRHALLDREVQGALIDTYVAAEYGDVIFQDGIKVNKLLDRSFGYGLVLSGSALYVKKQCRDYIAKDISWIYKIIEQRTKTLEVTCC